MFPPFFAGLAYQKTARHATSAEGTTQKNIKAMTMDNQKRIRRCSGMRYFRQSPNLPCLFSTFSPSFASQSVPFLKIYSTCVPFQQGAVFHFHRGIGASQRRHWCISTQALVHFNAGIGASQGGIGAFQRRHWCISTQALAFQCGHWCISAQALVHLSAGIGAFNAGTGAFQRRHWCISMRALVHFNAGIGASQGGIGAFQRRHWCIST